MAVTLAHLREAEAQSQVQPTLTQQSINMAQANLEAARSNLKAQQDLLNLMLNSTQPNAIVSAQAAYDQAKSQAANAKRNYEREQQLLKKGFVSQQIAEQSETNWQVAESHLRDVKEPLDRIQQTNRIQEENERSLIASAQGQVHQMAAALAQAKSAIDPLIKQQDLESARAAYAQAKAQLASAQSGRTQDLEKQDEAIAAEADYQNIRPVGRAVGASARHDDSRLDDGRGDEKILRGGRTGGVGPSIRSGREPPSIRFPISRRCWSRST